MCCPAGPHQDARQFWAKNDRDNPSLEFGPAGLRGAGALWIWEQPPAELTGHILFDEDLARDKGLEPRLGRSFAACSVSRPPCPPSRRTRRRVG